MKEAFEKIKQRLETELECKRNKQTIECMKHDGFGTPLQAKYSGNIEMLIKAIKIVNQVAEECDNDFCEWKSDFNWFSGKRKHETSCGYTFYDLKHAEPFKVCPYCGKEIKVVE